MNNGDGQPAEKLRRLSANLEPSQNMPWAEADLDGDGQREYLLALPVTDPGTPTYHTGQGAALAVIYRRGGRYVVDVSQRMSDTLEVWLLAPQLNGVADLTGAGRQQIIWSRPAGTVTGPQPLWVFVTEWQPGSFSTLPGEMVISRTAKEAPRVSIEGKDVVLMGKSRAAMFLPDRIDRYRFRDGAFRLTDRRFIDSGDNAYSRFWDGLIAEDVGRLADAEQAYRAALDPGRKPHAGQVPRYNNFPVQLSEEELAAFGEALRALARFRLGALLMDAGRQKEALDWLQQASGPYAGLSEALANAGTRTNGCQAATAWALTTPGFLAALNRGVADAPWTPELLCLHATIEDRFP